MYQIGYTTGTFDLTHQGHFEILKKCKFYCQKLIVGLVSDELGIRQKRQPVLTYQHRKDILENSKYVDSVVIFEGTTKQEDFLKLGFDILFISDEYYQKDEYSSFEHDYPHIPVVYFPRTVDISTSDIFKDIVLRTIKDTTKKSHGIYGNLMSVKWKNDKNIIIKPINVSERESTNTANCFYLPVPPPRNWKINMFSHENHPNIPGVNANRELLIHDKLKDKDWYPGFEIQEKSNYTKIYEDFGLEEDIELKEKIRIMERERQVYGKTFWLLQKDAGITLSSYLVLNKECDINSLYMKVRKIIEELIEMDIIHGDVHPGNILVDEKENVSLIDFGWCYHKSFDMDEIERDHYRIMLRDNFDLYHFRESLVFEGLEEMIPDILL